MNLSLSLLLLPLFAFSFFLRLGESSFYLFDLWFLVFLLISFKYLNKKDLNILFLFLFLFFTISLFGILNGLIRYSNIFELDKYLIALYRYTQLIFVLLIVALKIKTIVFDFRNINIYIYSVGFVLLYSVFFWFYNPEKVTAFNRLSGFFGDPNALGVFIAISLIPLLGSISLIKKTLYKYFLIIIFIFLYGFNLLYAGSNSYWIISFLALIFYFISNFKISFNVIRNFTIFTIFSFFTIVSFPFKIDTSIGDFQGLDRTLKFFEVIKKGGDIYELGSGNERNQLERDGVDLILSHPSNIILGVGLGQSPNYIGKSYGRYVTVHNSHLVLILELGILGYFFIFMFFLYIILKINKLYFHSFRLFLVYFLTMTAVPHVYLPIFWVNIVYGLIISKLFKSDKGK